MNKHNLEGFYKYYSNATKEQAIEDMYMDNCKQAEEIERLNNIINGMEKFFQYAYDNEVRPLNDRKVSVWTICLDKLKELKNCTKESQNDAIKNESEANEGEH